MTGSRVSATLAVGWLLFGCEGTDDHDSSWEEPRVEIGVTEQSTVGFSVADIRELGSPTSSRLTWKGPGAGFAGEPSNGETSVESVLSYDDGLVFAIGDPVWELEAELTLQMTTADGALNESVPCLLRARSADSWICSAAPTALTGSYRITTSPDGNFAYDVWISRRGGDLMGGVGAVVTTEEGTPTTGLTGSVTGFTAGVWMGELPTLE